MSPHRGENCYAGLNGHTTHPGTRARASLHTKSLLAKRPLIIYNIWQVILTSMLLMTCSLIERQFLRKLRRKWKRLKLIWGTLQKLNITTFNLWLEIWFWSNSSHTGRPLFRVNPLGTPSSPKYFMGHSRSSKRLGCQPTNFNYLQKLVYIWSFIVPYSNPFILHTSVTTFTSQPYQCSLRMIILSFNL